MRTLIALLVVGTVLTAQDGKFFNVDIDTTLNRNRDITKIIFWIRSQPDSILPDTSAFIKFDSLITGYPENPVFSTYKFPIALISNSFTYHFFVCKLSDHAGSLGGYSNIARLDAQFPGIPILRIINASPGDTLMVITSDTLTIITSK